MDITQTTQRNSDTPTRFVVLFEGRSGSTFLIESLASHPEIRTEKEYLSTLRKRIERGKAPPDAQLRWVEEFLEVGAESGCRAVGFKTKFRDILDPGELKAVLQRLGAKIILLRRRNRIKLLVSLMNAVRLNEKTGDWNLYDRNQRIPRLHIDPNEFAGWFEKTESRHRELTEYAEAFGLPMLKLFYEDILRDWPVTQSRVCEFLGVPARALQAGTQKHTSDDLRDVVINFAQLKAAYVGTTYEAMFDEVLVPEEPTA